MRRHCVGYVCFFSVPIGVSGQMSTTKIDPDTMFSTKQEVEEEKADDTIPKLWSLEDPCQYAPPRPDGDPWDVLLKPLLEKDRMQCNVWADEVQNLLIFAGLFSSVVTTFVIESYRNLQSNPEDAVVALLSRIATRLDNPLNTTAPTNSPVDIPPFTPTASSVRTNALWFVSLVLSLTTVLVGTISLQWLREHQSYPDLTPKQTYALYHMRSRALNAWHVPKLFTILPLFLQTAVVLFLFGLLDFLLEFGRRTIVIPVGVVTGLTLLFLICTTALPALQVISVYIRRSSYLKHTIIPDQCPYKSPQSYIFRNLSSLVLQTLKYITPLFKSRSFANLARLFNMPISTSDNTMPQFTQDTTLHYIRDTWVPQRTWVNFDLSWLSFRDSCTRSAGNKASKATKLGQGPDDSFPLFDATKALLRSLESTKTYPAAEYHCFLELSAAIPSKQHVLLDNWDAYETENEYFHDLLNDGMDDRLVSLSDYFQFNGPKQFQEMARSFQGVYRAEKLVKTLHHENIHMLLARMHLHHPHNKGISMHMLETKLRLLGYFYQESHDIQPDILATPYTPYLPNCLFIRVEDLSYNATLLVNDEFYSQLGAIILAFFKRIGSNDRKLLPNVIHPHLPHILRAARRAITRNSSTNSVTYNSGSKDGLITTFTYIRQRLTYELTRPEVLEGQPSLLFYVASLYVKALVSSLFDPELRTVLSTLNEYKKATIDRGLVDTEIEERCRTPAIYGPDVFSEDWWGFLNFYVDSSNIYVHSTE